MALDPAEIRDRLAAQRWTAHNVRLTPEIVTIPGAPELSATNLHWKAIERFLKALYRGRLEGLRAADLGCNEGGFALALAQQGAEVVGVEARADNIAKCRLLADHFALPNLRFEQADVKGFSRAAYGRFDVVLALGILYHLDDPVAWLRQVAEATGAVLYVDTHFAPVDDAALDALEPGLLGALGPMARRTSAGWEHEGRWFHEYDTEAQREGMPWASFSNADSFWLTRQSLFRTLHHCGFDAVLEQHEHAMRWLDRFTTSFPRLMAVGLKTAAFR
jgi:SAM-dependent methyltransferase